jgi:redox-sensitive bicupin YhaK (pirin superfamily)
MLCTPRPICFHANNPDKERASHLGAPQLVAPQSLGQRFTPFMSLDVLKAGERSALDETSTVSDSGTAIITFLLSGEAEFSDSTRKQGRLKQGDVLWMLSGSGLQYSLTPKTPDCVSVKLRVALSPVLESAPAQSVYLNSARIEGNGPARVLLGQHGHASGQVAFPALVNYMVVGLAAEQVWTYEPLANHQVAWIAVLSGKINTSNTVVEADEIAVYENSHQSMSFLAEVDTVFLLATSHQFNPHQVNPHQFNSHQLGLHQFNSQPLSSQSPHHTDQESTYGFAVEKHAVARLPKTFNKTSPDISVQRMCS